MKYTALLRWFLPAMALLLMALRIPVQTPWIDEAAIVTFGACVWGIPSQLPYHEVLYWLGCLGSFLFYEALPGGVGARWFSWLGAVFLLIMWELWARQNRVQALHRSTLAAALLFLPVVQFEGANSRLDLWAIGWAFAAFTAYTSHSDTPRFRAFLTGMFAGMSVAFWFTGLITLLLLPFLALSSAHSKNQFFKDRLRELPFMLIGFALPFTLMALVRYDHMMRSLQNLEMMISTRLEIGSSEMASFNFEWDLKVSQSLIATALLWAVVWVVRFPKLQGKRLKWSTEAGVVLGVLMLVMISHLYHGRLVYWLPIPFALIALNFHSIPKVFRTGLVTSILILGFGYSVSELPKRAKRALAPVNATVRLDRRLAAWQINEGDLIYCCGDYHLVHCFTSAPSRRFNGTFELDKLSSATHVFIDTARCASPPDAQHLQDLGFSKWQPASPKEFEALKGYPLTIPEVWIRKSSENSTNP